uniref:Uncharacterized protein n=1 Tax=Moniliophthora roreri TaxID=221103 RepID=A0A0W0G650_MONRR
MNNLILAPAFAQIIYAIVEIPAEQAHRLGSALTDDKAIIEIKISTQGVEFTAHVEKGKSITPVIGIQTVIWATYPRNMLLGGSSEVSRDSCLLYPSR